MTTPTLRSPARMRRVLAAALLIVLLLVPPITLAAPASPPTTPYAPALDAAAQKLFDLAVNPRDPNSLWLALMAQRERAGIMAPGSVTEIEKSGASAPTSGAAAEARPPPRLVWRETYRTCDLNLDGTDDLVENMYDYTTSRPTVYAIDGKTGKILWYYLGVLYYFPQQPFNRQGEPQPWRPDDLYPTLDINHNGVCDLLLMGMTFRANEQAGAAGVTVITVNVYLFDGAAGTILWTKSVDGAYSSVSAPAGVVQTVLMQGFPTGFLPFEARSGPRFVLKLSDLYFQLAQDPLGQVTVSNLWISEHVHVANTTNGQDVWLRDMPFATDSDITNLTWVTGVADLNGDGEPEVVLDQMFVYNPRSNQEGVNNPFTGKPTTRTGRGAAMLALRGGPDGGATLWQNVVRDEGRTHANPDTEDAFNLIVWTHGQVLGDISGDGVPDVVELVLTQEFNEAGSVNGQFRTIITPLNGRSGAHLWGSSEIRQQGWGYADDLNTANRTVPVLAFGTIDLPTDAPPEGRFPPKDVHLSVFDGRDGTTRWSYEEQFPQDSYLSYGLALQQYMHALAPLDANGDGIRDPITPSQYVRTTGNQQTLLSNARHTYTVLDANDGSDLVKLHAWGSNGFILDCGGFISVVSGYGRQIDGLRFDAGRSQPTWRTTMWIDPSFSSALAGSDVTFLDARCQGGRDNRTHLNVNIGLNSAKRGNEVVPVFGYVHEQNGTMIWLSPKPLLSPIYDFLNKTITQKQSLEPTRTEQVLWGAAPFVPGAALGFGIAFLGVRRRRGGI